MDQELDTLAGRTRQLLELVRRLADENTRLRADLAASQQACGTLNGRMEQARSRVEFALSRLPATAAAETEPAPDQGR